MVNTFTCRVIHRQTGFDIVHIIKTLEPLTKKNIYMMRAQMRRKYFDAPHLKRDIPTIISIVMKSRPIQIQYSYIGSYEIPNYKENNADFPFEENETRIVINC